MILILLLSLVVADGFGKTQHFLASKVDVSASEGRSKCGRVLSFLKDWDKKKLILVEQDAGRMPKRTTFQLIAYAECIPSFHRPRHNGQVKIISTCPEKKFFLGMLKIAHLSLLQIENVNLSIGPSGQI
jgi:hypothetical protein